MVAANRRPPRRRPRGGPSILYTRHVFRPDRLDAPPSTVAAFPADAEPLLRGSWDADIIGELAPAQDDVVIDKNRFDAFLYTDLEVVLRALRHPPAPGDRGRDEHLRRDSTVRSAQQRDFTVHVADATAPRPCADTNTRPHWTLMAYIFPPPSPPGRRAWPRSSLPRGVTSPGRGRPTNSPRPPQPTHDAPLPALRAHTQSAVPRSAAITAGVVIVFHPGHRRVTLARMSPVAPST
ncbi:isochorismatase family protein [Yinghuangia aomiensis]